LFYIINIKQVTKVDSVSVVCVEAAAFPPSNTNCGRRSKTTLLGRPGTSQNLTDLQEDHFQCVIHPLDV